MNRMNNMEILSNLKILELNFKLIKPTADSNYNPVSLSMLANKLIYNLESVLEKLILVQCDFILEDI